ncbi:MAG: hypothetical protein PHH54_04300 [Candidatus Nanoarchaeia archaeon]|nr:hypothetical protein [Candidatus Nanoarchaeia archaeon]MDD5741182.1 hypothetical protein [Candidatus Nanoarchaeia archaeon]
MEEEVKEQIWKIFMIASFLFVTIFFILPYLVQISTFFHERAHQKALDKYGIENSYKVNLLETIHNFYNPNVQKLGVTRFDLNKYEQLDKYKKAEVNIAGIVSDLRFLFLIGIYLSFVNIYLFYKIRFKKEYNVKWILAIDWVLFMWLLALIQITVANITYSSGDVYQLVRFIP